MNIKSSTFTSMATADTSFDENHPDTNVFEDRVVYKPEASNICDGYEDREVVYDEKLSASLVKTVKCLKTDMVSTSLKFF